METKPSLANIRSAESFIGSREEHVPRPAERDLTIQKTFRIPESMSLKIISMAHRREEETKTRVTQSEILIEAFEFYLANREAGH